MFVNKMRDLDIPYQKKGWIRKLDNKINSSDHFKDSFISPWVLENPTRCIIWERERDAIFFFYRNPTQKCDPIQGLGLKNNWNQVAAYT